jgi:hypothetical protein
MVRQGFAGRHAYRLALLASAIGIASNRSVDVTQLILTWIASLPNNSTLAFGSGGCYRIEGTLELSGRSGLGFEGNGSTFRAPTSPNDLRAIWRIPRSRSRFRVALRAARCGVKAPGETATNSTNFTVTAKHSKNR